MFIIIAPPPPPLTEERSMIFRRVFVELLISRRNYLW
jgi:hypothetical protein